MSDKEKAAREYSDDYKTLVPIDRTWAQISDTITLVSRESFLAGAEWAEKNIPCPSCADSFDAGVVMEEAEDQTLYKLGFAQELKGRDEEWLAEMKSWYQENYKASDGWNNDVWAVDMLNHMRQWAKGEG